MNNVERSLDLLNLIKAKEGAADAAMQAHYLVVNDSRKGKPIKELIDLVEYRVDVGGFLTKAAAALLSEAECIVNPLVLVVASEQVNLIWELYLEGHQEADRLEGVHATIDIITEEQVVVTLNIAVIVRVAPKIEESHQILILSVDIAEHFDGSIDT